MAAMKVELQTTRDHPNNIIYLKYLNAIIAAMKVGFKITRDCRNKIIYLD
jgi:hypothetical protein